MKSQKQTVILSSSCAIQSLATCAPRLTPFVLGGSRRFTVGRFFTTLSENKVMRQVQFSPSAGKNCKAKTAAVSKTILACVPALHQWRHTGPYYCQISSQSEFFRSYPIGVLT